MTSCNDRKCYPVPRPNNATFKQQQSLSCDSNGPCLDHNHRPPESDSGTNPLTNCCYSPDATHLSSPSIQVHQSNPFLSSSILNNNSHSCSDRDSFFGCVNVRITGVDESEKRFVLYEVQVASCGNTWHVKRRFSEFHHLLDILKKKYPRLSLKLPSKKIFVNNFSNELIKSRITGLNEFLQLIAGDQNLINSFMSQTLKEGEESKEKHKKVEIQFVVTKQEHSHDLVTISSGRAEKDTPTNNEVRNFFNLTKKFERDQSSVTDNGMDQGSGSDQDQPMEIEEGRSALNVVLGPSEVHHIKASDFEFLKLIGKGSFGKVLLARHIEEGQLYAVKVLSKKMILKRNEKSHIMCERSVLLKNLQHPFLVGLHYSFQSRDKLYFVMDYVNGGELFFHLQKERSFTESRAKFYAAEITSALGYLHSEGIVYRDLKPENILLDSDGHVVLTDFGLCKGGLRTERDTTNTFCGTPEYLAPEVLKKESYDRCVDWWCLGAVLYEMIYGLPPFYSRDTAEMYDQILYKPLRTKGNISLAARDLLGKLLEKDKNRRLGHINDADDIKQHDFFSTINWVDLEEKKIPPPFNPQVRGDLDLKNIDTEFTREPIPASVSQSNYSEDSSIPANAFEGFSYVDSSSNYS